MTRSLINPFLLTPARLAVPGWLCFLIMTGLLLPTTVMAETAATSAATEAEGNACPPPALSRLTRHRVAPGETLDAIAQQYNLIPPTLIGLNPSVQSGRVSVGQELLIPPFNGIRATVSPGQTWQDVAAIYNTRADVLFEVNGCVSTVPTTIFVPGINWFPGVRTAVAPAANQATPKTPLQGYPLPSRAEVIANYGWQPDSEAEDLVFNTGVALESAVDTPVLGVGAGTVAFAGPDPVYGNLVVVNHDQGLQTRYANLKDISVRVGQRLRQGESIAKVGPQTGESQSYLYFEVRLNSEMGWVAQDPQDYVPAMALR